MSVLERSRRLLSPLLALMALAVVAAAPLATGPSDALPANPVPVAGESAEITLPVSKFVPVVPTRVLDTRPDFPPNRGFARLAGDSALSVDPIDGTAVATQLANLGISPTSVTAVVVNNTLVGSGKDGFATVWPTGFGQPLAATNYAWFNGQNAPNLVIAPLGLDGKISIYSLPDADYVVDVVGVMVASTSSSDGRLVTLGPIRHSDTRSPGLHVPGQQRYSAGETRSVDLTGVGVPPSASAVVLNVTAVQTAGQSFVTVWPAGSANPGTASVSISRPGEPVGNQVISGVTNGTVNVFSLTATDLVIDVFGYFTGTSAATATDGLFVPMSPTRLLDTRDTTGSNAFTAGAQLTPGVPLRLPIAGRYEIPSNGVKAGALNFTAVQPGDAGFITAYPSAAETPLTSSLNYTVPGSVVPNHALTPVASSGSIDIFSPAPTHLVVDATGYFIDGTEPLPSGSAPTKTIRQSTFVPATLNGASRPTSAPYDFLFDRAEIPNRPAPSFHVAWNRCRPIRYALNVDLANDAQIEVLIASIEQAELRTGLDFQFAGVTSAGLNISDQLLLADSFGLPFQYLPPDDDGSGPVDAVIGFSNAQLTPDLGGGVIGVGGSLRTGFDAFNRAEAARGFAIIDLGDLGDGSPNEIANLTATTTHELGHMLGLGHVSGAGQAQGLESPGTWTSAELTAQLMFPSLNTAATGTTFSPGDQLGLWELYNSVEQSCGNSLMLDADEPLVAVQKILDGS